MHANATVHGETERLEETETVETTEDACKYESVWRNREMLEKTKGTVGHWRFMQ